MQDIVDRLRKGCNDEGVTISEDALLAIARGAEGGLRDAESALDQIISFRGKEIEEGDVLSVFGLVSRHVLENLTVAILKSDVPEIINIVAEMDRAGKDLQRVVMELMEHVRNLLVVLYAGNGSSALELPEAQMKFYTDLAAETEAGRVLRVIDALVETDGRMRYALSKKTLLETGLIRCSRAATTVTLNELLKQVTELKKNFKSGDAPGVISETPEQTYSVEPQKKKPAADEVKQLLERWPHVIDHLSKADPLARRYFIDTVPLRTDATHLVVGFDPEFASEQDRFDTDRTKLMLAREVEKQIGRMLGVVFEPFTSEARKALPSNQVVSTAPNQELDGLQKWYANPVVKTVVEAFNGEISEIRE